MNRIPYLQSLSNSDLRRCLFELEELQENGTAELIHVTMVKQALIEHLLFDEISIATTESFILQEVGERFKEKDYMD